MTWGLSAVFVDIGGRPALQDVDVLVEPGEIVAVVGGDGSGKTTVARTLVGILNSKRGTVARPDQRRIGYLPATSGVWPDLTVTENLVFVADVYRIGKAERGRRIDHLLETTALAEARSRLGSELSGGMRQKLGFAMALLAEPELVVLDEPSTGVDPVSRSELWTLMTSAASAGTAVLFTTTYLDEAERAHSITALDGGRVLASGDIAAIARAVPGVIVDTVSSQGRDWRRGAEWRSWRPDGTVPHGSRAVEPDLTDVLVAASLAAEEQRR